MKMRNNWAKIGGIFVAFILVVGVFTSLGVSGALADILGITSPKNVMLYPCNSPDEMSVTWWDAETVTAGQVVYGTSQDLSDASAFDATATVSGDTENGYSAFEAKLTGLTAGTKYYYKVGQNNTWSQTYSFTTEENDDTDFSFLYLGDVQYSDVNHIQQEYDDWADLVTNATTNNQLDFALMAGDMVQQSNNVANWDIFLGDASKNFASLPMLAVTGNHETVASTGIPECLQKYMALPTNGPDGFKERFYSYDYGNAHIVVLDSNVFSGEQKLTESQLTSIKNWIVDDLADSSATWKIVAMHHPAYAVVSDKIADQVMANWVDVFENAQVDLVLCGHQHIYMRTYPMYNGKKNPNGITYVMGNSGKKFYAKADVFYSSKMIDNTSTYQVISIDNDTLTAKTCDKEGNVLDNMTLISRNREVPIEDIPEVEGDIDGSTDVTQSDYDIIINAILNCTTNTFMDVNKDGKVNIADAHRVQNIINADN